MENKSENPFQVHSISQLNPLWFMVAMVYGTMLRNKNFIHHIGLNYRFETVLHD